MITQEHHIIPWQGKEHLPLGRGSASLPVPAALTGAESQPAWAAARGMQPAHGCRDNVFLGSRK